ncbi:hypothetical protein LLG95_05135, partial [bacterium]|nr:hypothetical protein [bacterium]
MTQIVRAFFATILLATVATQPLAAARVVHFPADRPAGSVKISPPAPAGETKFQRLSFGWPDYGSAQGDVTVPDRCQLLLTVHPRRHPLSPLAQLGPNDVDQLCVSTDKNEPVNFNTEVLPYIKHLTGLKALYLNAITIDTAGIRGLANFPSLRFFQRTSMDAHPKTLSDSDLALFRKLKSLEILYVSSERITDAGLAYLGEIKSLRELTINATNIKGPGFAELARLPALEYLSPSGFGFDDSRLTYLKPLTNIKRLGLGNPHNKITDAGLATIATMRNIEEIDLHWNEKITDAGVAHLASMPALKSIDIHNARLLTAKGAVILGKITTLEELDLPFLNDASVAELRNLHHLKSLKSGSSAVTDAGMKHLENLSNLEELWIGGAQVGDAGMNSLAKLTRLKKLFISSALNLTDKGLAPLSTLRSLTELRLPHSYGKDPKLTIGGLSQLNACTSLRLLDARNIKQDGAGLNLSALAGLEKLSVLMERPSRLTDRDLAGLGNLTRLQELDLRGFPESDGGRSMDITDAGLVHLGNLSSLNRLTITGGPNLTDAGLASLAGLNRLTDLDIGGNFTDGALSRLGATVALRGLHSLRISGDFTSDGLLALAPMKMMTRLDLKTGRHLDPAAVKRLEASLPMMSAFSVQGDRALPTPSVSPKLLSPSAALTEPRPAGRVVHFPTDRPLGRVSISISKEKDPIFSDLMEVAGQNGGEFEFIDHGPVKGDVFVPA